MTWERVARWEQPDTPSLHHVVIPASEGRHLHRTWIGARWRAFRLNWWLERRVKGHLPPCRWVVRRLRSGTPSVIRLRP